MDQNATDAGSPAVQRSALRLLSHLRLSAAGLALLLKLGVLGIILLAWSSSTLSSYPDHMVANCLDTGIMAGLSIAAIRLCTIRHRHPIRLAMGSAALMLALAAGNTWLMSMTYPTAGTRLVDMVPHILCGVAAAVIATLLTRPALRWLAGPGSRMQMALWLSDDADAARQSRVFSGVGGEAMFCAGCGAELPPHQDGQTLACPTCGQMNPSGAFRIAMERFLWRCEGAVIFVMSVWRMALLGIVALIACGVATSAYETARQNALNPMSRSDTLWVVWLGPLGLIAGAAISLALLHLAIRWRRILLALLAMAAVLGGLAALLTRSSGEALQSTVGVLVGPLALIIGAILGGWPAWALARLLIRKFVPAELQQHLIAAAADPVPPAAVAAGNGSLYCEQCGYALQGLPRTRCEGCMVVSLRCPECGHSQPANTAIPQLRRWIHRAHLVLRILAILMKGLAIGLPLLLWFTVFFNISPGEFWQMQWRQLAILCIAFAWLLVPIRMALLRRKPAWMFSLLTLSLVITVACIALAWGGRGGRQSIGWQDDLASLAWLVPAWAFWCFATPWLYRAWLAVFLPRSTAGAVHAWQTSRPMRRQAVDESSANPTFPAGSEWETACPRCAVELRDSPLQKCPQCGVHSLACGECGRPRPIAATRLVLEETAGRMRLFALGAFSIAALTTVGICLFSVLQHGESSVWRLSPDYFTYANGGSLNGYLADSYLSALAGGALLRLILICRRQNLAVAVGLAAAWTGMLLLGMLSPSPREHLYAFGLPAGEAMCVLLGAMLARPMLDVVGRFLLPAATSRAVIDWATGRQSMDDAAGTLAEPVAAADSPVAAQSPEGMCTASQTQG